MDEAVGGPLLSPPQHFSVDGDAISTFSWDSLKKKINGTKPLVPGGKMDNQCGAEQGNVPAADQSLLHLRKKPKDPLVMKKKCGGIKSSDHEKGGFELRPCSVCVCLTLLG